MYAFMHTAITPWSLWCYHRVITSQYGYVRLRTCLVISSTKTHRKPLLCILYVLLTIIYSTDYSQ